MHPVHAVSMAALHDAIAQIDALITRLQTDSPASGALAPASHAASRPPVLAALSTDEQLRVAGATAAPASAATALSASAAAAAARSATDSGPAAGAQPPSQSAAGGPASGAAASVTAGGLAEAGASPAPVGRAKTGPKPAKAPKAAPAEPTPADLFAKAQIQVMQHFTRPLEGWSQLRCRGDTVPPPDSSCTNTSRFPCLRGEGNHPDMQPTLTTLAQPSAPSSRWIPCHFYGASVQTATPGTWLCVQCCYRLVGNPRGVWFAAHMKAV